MPRPPPRPPALFLPALFLLCALPALLFLALQVPTGETPDEVAHIIRMDSLLHGVVLGHRRPAGEGPYAGRPDSGVRANPALLPAGFSFLPGTPLAQRTLSRERAAQLAALPWAPAPTFVSVPNTAVYPPPFYVPGAAAMQAARWFGAGPWHAILAARVANALTYAALGLAALLLAQRLRGLLFATLLLPISLWMAASCNQDGLIIAAAALAAALLTRATRPAWWAAAVAVAAIGMAKPPYAPLAGVVFLLMPHPPLSRPGLMLPRRAAGALLAFLPALLWYVAASRLAAVPFVRGPPFRAGPYWPGDPDQVFAAVDPALQLQVFLHQPLLLLRLPLEQLAAQGGWLLWEMVGILGILDVALPAALYGLWFAAVAALAVGESLAGPAASPGVHPGLHPGLHPGPRPWACLAVLACVLATVLAVFDGQYLSWTYTGAAEIEGIQGRYLVPLLPFLALALPTVRVRGGGTVRAVLRVPAVLAGLAGLAVIPGLVVAAYYLR